MTLAGCGELRGVAMIRRLAGGGWNETWLASRGGERLVVRVDTPAVSVLGLDRAAEIEVLRSVQGSGLAPQLVFSDIRRGVLVTRWQPGRVCTVGAMRNPRMLRALGAMFRRLHETLAPPPGIAPLDPAVAVDHYASLVGGAWQRRAARQARRAFKAAAGNRRPAALCHNDPVVGNILDASTLRLLDWEFAAPGDPLFDLAVVIGHHRLGQRQAHILLAAARGRAHPCERRALAHLVEGYAGLRLIWEAAAAIATGSSRPATGILQRPRVASRRPRLIAPRRAILYARQP